jgi:DNA repair exonuclease SbcCD nuclease subunit
MFRFLHAADIHLDSPLVGLERYDSAPVDTIRGATRRAFENLVQTAIDERVAFVLLAGDLYDGDWKDWRTGLFFNEQMTKLREARVPVFLVAGNHDAESQITRHLRLPDNVHRFSTKRPETRRLDDLGVAVHGQGFGHRAVPEDLAQGFPAADPGLFNIALLHTSLNGRPGHDVYAPTTIDVLAQKGYGYWALGHVHRREEVSKAPWVVFPGNLQGRHARETGPKGFTLVTVDDGAVIDVAHRDADVVRWEACSIDVDGLSSGDAVIERVADRLQEEAKRAGGRTLAVRVLLQGEGGCHQDFAGDPVRWINEVRAVAAGVGQTPVWIEKVQVDTRAAADLAVLAARDDALGSILRECRDAAPSPEEAAVLRETLEDLRRALPPELLSGAEPADPRDPALFAQLVREGRDLLVARIAREEQPR